MPRGKTLPYSVKELKKAGALDEDKFYATLSEQCNYIDVETAKKFYMGLVRAVTKILKNEGVVRLPLIGDICLLKTKRTTGIVGRAPDGSWMRGPLGTRYVITFSANAAWNEYFSKLSKIPGASGRLDPRERMLGIDLGD